MRFLANGQVSTDYLAIVGVGLAAIAVGAALIFILLNLYQTGSTSNKAFSAVNSVVNEIDYVVAQGAGSEVAFPVQFGAINTIKTGFCGKTFTLFQDGYSASAGGDVNITGILPMQSGTYTMYARSVLNGAQEVGELGISGKIAFINSSYTPSSNAINYGLSFSAENGSLLKNIVFNITVLFSNYTYVNSTIGAETTGTGSGSIHVKTAPSYVVEVFPQGYNIFSPTCLTK